jgi:hypothetical protein
MHATRESAAACTPGMGSCCSCRSCMDRASVLLQTFGRAGIPPNADLAALVADPEGYSFLNPLPEDG